MTDHASVEARQILDSNVSERIFQAVVVEYAVLNGWLVYHTHNSRHSVAGFPDLVLVRGQRLIFAELKTVRGRVSDDQTMWMNALDCSAAEVYLWRPTDWPDIEEALCKSAGRHPTDTNT